MKEEKPLPPYFYHQDNQHWHLGVFCAPYFSLHGWPHPECTVWYCASFMSYRLKSLWFLTCHWDIPSVGISDGRDPSLRFEKSHSFVGKDGKGGTGHLRPQTAPHSEPKQLSLTAFDVVGPPRILIKRENSLASKSPGLSSREEA